MNSEVKERRVIVYCPCSNEFPAVPKAENNWIVQCPKCGQRLRVDTSKPPNQILHKREKDLPPLNKITQLENIVKNLESKISLFGFLESQSFWTPFSSGSSFERKLEGALNYADPIMDEEVEMPILLYDSSAFGSGKTGFLLTSRALYWKNMLENPKEVLLTQIYSLENERSITVNGHKIETSSMSSRNRKLLYELLVKTIYELIEINY